MKYVQWIMLLSLCFFVHASRAQKANLFAVTYRPFTDKATAQSFIADINRNSGVVVEYASSSIDTARVITLTGEPATVGAVLQQVLRGEKLSIVQKNNKIILVPAPSPLPDDAFISFYSVYGIIKEAVSQEPLAEATVWSPHQQKGTYSNSFGYFTLLLPEGKNILQVSYAGYTTEKLSLDISDNTRLDILLEPRNDFETVTITSASAGREYTEGVDKVDGTQTPYGGIILGEEDVLRSLYVQPGIKNIAEITNGVLVRGGSPDQNIFLLDGSPVFNPTHLLGTLSIVNKTSLKSMNLYKSNFPARYGGGLSSVIDVFTKDGNMKEWKGEVNAGLLAASFTVEGPVKKDKAAIMLSVRNSWVNPFLRMMHSNFGINFYDLHFKYTQLIGQKDKLMLNVYAGHDHLTLQQDNNNNKQQWGNKAASITWNRVLGSKAFVNTSVSVSDYDNIAGFRYALYDSATGNNVQNKVYNTFSSIEQYNVSTQLEFTASNAVKFNIGGKASYTKIKPFDTNVSADFIDNPDQFSSVPPLSFRKFVLFYENEFRLNRRLYLRPGVHASYFQYNSFHAAALQPRFYAVYKLSASRQISLAYSRMVQNLHQVTNPYLGINSDVWVPSTAILHPEESDMINLGYNYYGPKKFTFSAEVYYKEMHHVTNYDEGKNLFLNDASWEQNVVLGKGWCYGVEMKAEKKANKWQAFIGYTLSWNWRRFSDVNDGNKFPFKYDRRHELDASATWKPSRRWDVSFLWTFATGDVFTLPDQIYPDFDNAQQIADPLAPREYRLIYHSSATNQYRTLPYHRLDISAGYHHKVGKWPSLLTMGVYNLYGSPNQYVYDLEGTLGKRSLVVGTRYQFFNTTPYLSYTVTF